MRSWLENLQKCEPIPAPPKTASAPVGEFADLFRIDGEAATKTAKAFDDGAEDIPSASEAIIKAGQARKFRIPEFPTETSLAKEGKTVQKVVDGELRKFVYAGGKLVEQSDEDNFRVDPPSLAGLYVETPLAKVIGICEADQSPVERLAK